GFTEPFCSVALDMKTGFQVCTPERLTAGVTATLGIIAIAWLSWPFFNPLFSRWSHRRTDFSRDIRPIFNQNCVACHGGVRQKNGVSFIFREGAPGQGKSGRHTLGAGHADAVESISRITAHDPQSRMPGQAPWR